MLTAAGEALLATGCEGVTAREICRRAGVSSSTFYSHFENVDACLLAAHAMSVECICELIGAACQEPAREWRDRLRSGIDTAIAFLLSEPAFARLLCADLAVGVAAVGASRERLLDHLADRLGAGRRLHPGTAERLSPQVEICLAGATIGLFGDRIAFDRIDTLPGLTAELAEILA
jgi:AcrR family transcriptional regulator